MFPEDLAKSFFKTSAAKKETTERIKMYIYKLEVHE